MGIHIGHLINREKIDIAMLIKISKVLQHNFFQDIANLIDDGKCLKSLDNMSRNSTQSVQNVDTAS